MNPLLLQHFGLRDQPFAVTPDPRFLYESETHREALASLLYGIDSDRGFLALIGKPGMGKTTILFRLLEQYRNRALTAFLFQTQCEWREFLSYLFADLGIECPDANNLVTMHQRLNRMLGEQARRGRFCLIVIDEAQNLDSRALETVRLLSDFETSRTKLLQIVLAGQPSFEDKLADPSLLQLRQRLSMVCRLSPLGEREVNEYIDYRLRIARHNGNGVELFTAGAREEIATLSEGIPRVISNICFNSMSLAFATGHKRITREIVNEVGADLALVPQPAALGKSEAAAHQSKKVVSPLDVSSPEADQPHPAPVRETATVLQPITAGRPACPQTSEDGCAQTADSGSTATAPGTVAPVYTAIHQRSVDTVGRPALRIVEKTVFTMAGAAAVLALIMWFYSHRPLNINHLLTPQSIPSQTRTATEQDESGGNRDDAVQQSAAFRSLSGRSVARSVHTKDSIPRKLSQDGDTTQRETGTQLPLTGAVSSSKGVLQPQKILVANVPARTRVPILERGSLTARNSGSTVSTQPATVTRMVKPEYPEVAKSASIQGVVTLQALVDTQGLVKEVHILEGDPALRDAAVQAVRRWQYLPYRENGVPMMFRTIIRIRFMLDENPDPS